MAFNYKCPPTDQTLYRKISVPIGGTLPTSAGGSCQDGCYNHFGADLSSSADWVPVKLDFKSAFKRSPGWGSPVNPPDFTDHLNEISDFEWNNATGNVAGSAGVDFWVDEVEFF